MVNWGMIRPEGEGRKWRRGYGGGRGWPEGRAVGEGSVHARMEGRWPLGGSIVATGWLGIAAADEAEKALALTDMLLADAPAVTEGSEGWGSGSGKSVHDLPFEAWLSLSGDSGGRPG